MDEDSDKSSGHITGKGDLRAQSASVSGQGRRGVEGSGNVKAQLASVVGKAEIGRISFVGQGVTDEMFPGVAAVLAKQLREDHEKRREDRRQEEGRNHEAEQRGKDRVAQIVVTVIAAILAFVAGRLTN